MKHFVKDLLQAPGAASLALFAREILANPRAMGAACPSAPLLAACMASRVPMNRDGLVIEVGGGTGAVTAALLKHGLPLWKLVVVERSPHLTHHLRQRFPKKISSIVSSLPLRSLHPATTRAISDQFETLLETGGLLIQYTYDLRGTGARLLPRFRRLSSKIIWGNLPPARVEVFERQG